MLLWLVGWRACQTSLSTSQTQGERKKETPERLFCAVFSHPEKLSFLWFLWEQKGFTIRTWYCCWRYDERWTLGCVQWLWNGSLWRNMRWPVPYYKRRTGHSSLSLTCLFFCSYLQTLYFCRMLMLYRALSVVLLHKTLGCSLGKLFR